jgi:hypothetical protein
VELKMPRDRKFNFKLLFVVSGLGLLVLSQRSGSVAQVSPRVTL